MARLEDEEGSKVPSSAVGPCQPRFDGATLPPCSDADLGSGSVVRVLLGSFRGEGTKEKQEILVLLVLHLEI